MNTKRTLWILVAVFGLAAVSTSYSLALALNSTPVTLSKQSTEVTVLPTWIVAIATAVVALATLVYAFFTGWLIWEQRKSRLDDKFPCIVVRARLDRRATAEATAENEWTIRLVNIGRGPAFIEYFHTKGLDDCSCEDGDHTDNIDKVIGPDVGDPHLQVAFAQGQPAVLRSPNVTIVIHYRDMSGRLFKGGITAGKPVYEPPWKQRN